MGIISLNMLEIFDFMSYTWWMMLEGVRGDNESKALFKTGPSRAGCSGLCPVQLKIFPKTERPQPPWVAGFDNTHSIKSSGLVYFLKMYFKDLN